MSDMAEKFEQRSAAFGKRARAKLKQLRERYGFETSQKEADEVHIIAMSGAEVWIRISGKGPEAIFEKYEADR